MTPLEEALLVRVRELENLVASLQTPVQSEYGSHEVTKEKFLMICQFYKDNPDATLDDGIASLGIPQTTLSRYHAGAVRAGIVKDFPKNRTR